jgi:nucleoside-diphosphate-sugar epimerase
VPELSIQFIHEEDLGHALFLCILGEGPASAYNIAGDGIVTVADITRELGLVPLSVPRRPVESTARIASALAGLPGMPPVAGWVEALSHPAIMDTGRAKRELGWVPRYTGIEAVRDALA